MKRKFSIFGLVLLLIWILPVALNVPLVQADAGGTGKFLTIEIVGEGYVKATKVQSGEIWEFYWADPPMIEKVGAGTIKLEAFASDGWEFSHWEGDLTGSESPTDYKTQKYGYVMAVFVRKTYTITATASGNGAIEPEGEVLVEHGADQTFDFVPDLGYHVSSIVVDPDDDGHLRRFALNYTFYNVTADHIISVSFSADGTAIVDAGYDVYAFLAAAATLGFDETEGGVATGESVDYPAGTYAVIWDINVPFAFVGEGLVCLEYDDTGLSEAEESNLRLIHAESKWAFLSDVNQDLRVDGTDVSIVANAVKQSQWYNPWCDINNDARVDEDDVNIVNDNIGAFLEDITVEVNTELNLICGRAPWFSIFGAR